jgi:hypothetical protein
LYQSLTATEFDGNSSVVVEYETKLLVEIYASHTYGRVALLHGRMPAEVLIQTGARTFADYLLRPILDSFARAFRED